MIDTHPVGNFNVVSSLFHGLRAALHESFASFSEMRSANMIFFIIKISFKIKPQSNGGVNSSPLAKTTNQACLVLSHVQKCSCCECAIYTLGVTLRCEIAVKV
jgi:hypothetical protein